MGGRWKWGSQNRGSQNLPELNHFCPFQSGTLEYLSEIPCGYDKWGHLGQFFSRSLANCRHADFLALDKHSKNPWNWKCQSFFIIPYWNFMAIVYGTFQAVELLPFPLAQRLRGSCFLCPRHHWRSRERRQCACYMPARLPQEQCHRCLWCPPPLSLLWTGL